MGLGFQKPLGDDQLGTKAACLRQKGSPLHQAAVRGTFSGSYAHCQRLQAVLCFGLMPPGRVSLSVHAEGEHLTGGISFLLNGTKQLTEELDISLVSSSSGNKQVKHMRGISLQGNEISAAFITPHLP